MPLQETDRHQRRRRDVTRSIIPVSYVVPGFAGNGKASTETERLICVRAPMQTLNAGNKQAAG